jgi:hypothetical protein
MYSAGLRNSPPSNRYPITLLVGYLKNKTKKTGGVTQLVERLPSKHQNLSSSPRTAKTQNKTRTTTKMENKC